MMQTLIDTDILSFYLKGDSKVAGWFNSYLDQYDTLEISIISYYEILSGLTAKRAERQMREFKEFVRFCNIHPLSLESVTRSSEIYAKLKSDGTLIDDMDILIAGIAIANNFTLATHNTRHFNRVDGLKLSDWKN